MTALREKAHASTKGIKRPSDEETSIAKVQQYKKKILAIERKLDEQFQEKMDLWDHFIHTHQGHMMNANGIFRNATNCEIKMGLHTNSGYYFGAEIKCANKNEICTMCKLVQTAQDVDEPHANSLLRALAVTGFFLYGFYPRVIDGETHVRLFDEQVCTCYTEPEIQN